MIERKFDSFDEFLTKVKEPSNHPKMKASTATGAGYGQNWDLGVGWGGAMKLAREGWPEGLERMRKLVDLLELPKGSRSYEPRPVMALAGDEVDIGTYLSGEPECMVDWETVETPSFGKVVKVLVHLTANCNVSADAMFRRGALAFLIIDTLESYGLRCEVWGVVKCSNISARAAEPNYFAQVCIRDADQPCEPDRLAFMLAHPAVFRRFGFKLMELDPDYQNSDYGTTKNVPERMRGEDVVYLGPSHLAFNTDEQVLEAAKEMAAEYIAEPAL